MFEFSMKAYKYYREGYTEIQIKYRFGEHDIWNIIAEIVPRERFCEDKKFAKYVIDNLLDRARSEISIGMDVGGHIIVKTIREWHKLAEVNQAKG